MDTIKLNLLCNAAVSLAMILGIVILYPIAGGHAFWLLLTVFAHDSVKKSAASTNNHDKKNPL